MKITAFWSASVSNSIHYVLGSVCGPDGLGLLKGAAGAVCAVVIKIKGRGYGKPGNFEVDR